MTPPAGAVEVPFTVIIPARFGSTRLPGKALRAIAGRPMIEHVWARACASAAQRVVVATDDGRIEAAARGFGAEVCMTATHHLSGTDRVAEVAARLQLPPEAIVVNLQGDEPLVPPAIIDQVAANLAARPHMHMATLCEPLDEVLLHDPSAVKVVRGADGRALYFSRATIPWYRDAFAQAPGQLPEAAPAGPLLRRHVGLYAYRVDYLRELVALAPCALELAESLEQLRALYHGGLIHVDEACEVPGPGVDTEADLARVEALLRG